MYELIELDINDCSRESFTITEDNLKESIADELLDEANWNKYVVPIAQDNLTAHLGDIISKYVEQAPPRYYGLSNENDPYICQEKEEQIIWDMNIGAISLDVGERPYFSRNPVVKSGGFPDWSTYGMASYGGTEQIMGRVDYNRLCDSISECFPERIKFVPIKAKAVNQNRIMNTKPLTTDAPIPAKSKRNKRKPIRKEEAPMKTCTICNRSVRLLRQHIKRQHGVNKVACQNCGKEFCTNYKLRMHMTKCL